MSNVRSLLVALPALALLGGCAQVKNPEPEAPLPNDSQALTIMKGANTAEAYNLRDVDRERIKEAAQDSEAVSRSLAGAAGTASVAQAGAGTIDLLGGGTVLATALVSGPAHGSGWLDAYVWLPADQANTPEEAANKIANAFARGLEQTFSEAGWSKVEVEQTHGANGKSLQNGFRATISGSKEKPLLDFQVGGLQKSLTTKPVPEPAFLGGDGSVWGIYRKTGDFDVGGVALSINSMGTVHPKRYAYEGEKLAEYGLPKSPSAFIRELSGNLPEWIAFYSGPRWDSEKEYPRVYYQGKELLFVEPPRG